MTGTAGINAREWNVFPVPADDQLNLIAANSGPATIVISDMTGRIIKQEEITLISGQSVSLSTIALLDGLYQIQMIDKKTDQITKKLFNVLHR
jgi:hypothetical protein